MLPAAPFVAAAAAVVGILTGVVPSPGDTAVTTPKTSNASAVQSYAQLAQLASSGASPSSISAAARRFHADLAPLVAAAGSNPAAAAKAIALLQSEPALISGEADSPTLQAVLEQANLLVQRLQASLPKQTHVITPVAPTAPERRHSSTAPKSSPAAKPSPSPSPKPSPSASPKSSPSASPHSSSSSSPSASPSGGPIPGSLPG